MVLRRLVANGNRNADRRAWFRRDAVARPRGPAELLRLPQTTAHREGTDRYRGAATGDRSEATRSIPDPASGHRDFRPSPALRRATATAAILLQRGGVEARRWSLVGRDQS